MGAEPRKNWGHEGWRPEAWASLRRKVHSFTLLLLSELLFVEGRRGGLQAAGVSHEKNTKKCEKKNKILGVPADVRSGGGLPNNVEHTQKMLKPEMLLNTLKSFPHVRNKPHNNHTNMGTRPTHFSKCGTTQKHRISLAKPSKRKVFVFTKTVFLGRGLVWCLAVPYELDPWRTCGRVPSTPVCQRCLPPSGCEATSMERGRRLSKLACHQRVSPTNLARHLSCNAIDRL